MRQRPQYLLRALAHAGHPVWFVDPTLETRIAVKDDITLVNSLKPTPRRDVIVYTHFAPRRTLIDRFERPSVIYDLLDDLTIYDVDEADLPVKGTARHHHASLIRDADIVIASNPVLVARNLAERADILLVENGVDTTQFTRAGEIDTALPDGVVVGYHGAIAPWLDFDLLAEVARARPDYSFVLVGPLEDRARQGVAGIEDIENIHLFPAQPPGAIASFVRGFDVGLVPFVIDEMTTGVTPLKMYEYMACGVEVVGTPLPACVNHPLVATASSPGEMIEAIEAALLRERGAALREAAEVASWDRRISPLVGRLEEAGLRHVPSRF